MRRVPPVKLGNTGLEVSKLGFGTFDFGIPSLNISPKEGGRILIESRKFGINFWDTAEGYGTHPHVAYALKHLPRGEVVVSTKTYVRSIKGVKESLKNSLKELGTDYVDVFMLHCVERGEIGKCRQLLKWLSDAKTSGEIRAAGLSTHSVAVVREMARSDDVDVIMAVCCGADQETIDKFHGRVPLKDGSINDMLHAIELAHSDGKGTVAMKVLGGGAPPFVEDYRSSIKAIAQLSFVDAMVVGMRNLDEVRRNVEAIASC